VAPPGPSLPTSLGDLGAADVLRLQRAAGNAAVARLIDDRRRREPPGRTPPSAPPTPGAPGGAAPARPPGAPGVLLQRDTPKDAYSVVPPMLAADRDRRFFDPADKTVKPVWTEQGGYVKNPSAKPLDDAMKNGRVGGGFENGTFMYVVDTDGKVILGKRLGEPGGQAGRATGMPHPTLIGGTDPKVLAAGELEVRGGRIFSIDNQSGHYQPTRQSMKISVRSFMKLPTSAFHPEFAAESVHFDAAGIRTTKSFKTFEMLKLKGRDFKNALKGLKPRAIVGKLKSQRFKSGAKTVAGAVVTVLVMLALQWLLGKLMERIYNDFIQKQIDDLSPKIEDDLHSKQDQAEALLEEDSDADIYVNVRLSVDFAHMTQYATVDPDGTPEPPSELDIPPVVFLVDTGFSRQPWDTTPIEKHEQSCGSRVDKTIITSSVAISPSDFFANDLSSAIPGSDQQSPSR
jgi:hypothetical protein